MDPGQFGTSTSSHLLKLSLTWLDPNLKPLTNWLAVIFFLPLEKEQILVDNYFWPPLLDPGSGGLLQGPQWWWSEQTDKLWPTWPPKPPGDSNGSPSHHNLLLLLLPKHFNHGEPNWRVTRSTAADWFLPPVWWQQTGHVHVRCAWKIKFITMTQWFV